MNTAKCSVCGNNNSIAEYNTCPICHNIVCGQCMTTLLKSIGGQSRRKICYICKERLTGILTQKNLLRLECSLKDETIRGIIANPNFFILCYDYGIEEEVEFLGMFRTFQEVIHSLEDESLGDIKRSNIVIWNGKGCKIKLNAELYPE